jgi:transcriptional regulator with GAF, ATPase, and Fis domain
MASTAHIISGYGPTLIGSSQPMVKIIELIRLIADRRSTVLILGETGCGKEVVARAIHAASPRAAMPFVPLNCAAIPRELLEAELFGHVKGAFTGAAGARAGHFEQADKGTLFLDEIGDMSLDLQAKLLRVLQEREFQRVGNSETVKVDVRVIAATNADLLKRVKQGSFREDLYYRLHVVPIFVPPLRERKEDIPALAQHFLKKVAEKESLPSKMLTPQAVARLCEHPWPGNVRELEHVIEMAAVLSGERTELDASDFPLRAPTYGCHIDMTDEELVKLPEQGLDFEAVMARIEMNLLAQALERANGNKSMAADLLRLKRTTLVAKLKSLEHTLPAERV